MRVTYSEHYQNGQTILSAQPSFLGFSVLVVQINPTATITGSLTGIGVNMKSISSKAVGMS